MNSESKKFGLQPLYPLKEAASILRVSVSTLRWWVQGRGRGPKQAPMERVIDADDGGVGEILSFFNLIECHFLVAYKETGISLQAVRRAILHIREADGIDRPLLGKKFESDGISLFYDWAQRHQGPKLVNATSSGQLAWPEVVRGHFKDIDYSEEWPIQIWLLGRERPIVANPRIEHGLPTVATSRVRTEVIFDRFLAGEEPEEIAEDFSTPLAEITEALRWENRDKAA